MRRREAGFTLAETILVLIVGAVMLGGATLLYQQMRDSAASALAQQKVSALQIIVEKYQAANPGQIPTNATDSIVAQWVASRADYDTSPWGGLAQCVTSTGSCITIPNPSNPSGPAVFSGIRDIPVTINATTRANGSTAVAGDAGVLDFIHVTIPVNYISGQDRHLATWDNNLKLWIFTNEFAVAIENQAGNQFYFAHGPVVQRGGSNCPSSSTSPNMFCGSVGSPPAGAGYSQ